MKYRQVNLLAAESITTAGTKTIDIRATDPISRITAEVALTNSDWTPTGHPAKAVTKIELVDGATPLHSMRGQYTQALAFYGTKDQPYNAITFSDNGKAKAAFPIYFGRKLWDPELALDPSRHDNLQLKITHNYALGGCSPDAATLEVWADVFDEKPSPPTGFLSGSSLWSKTLVASTNDYVNLPTDKVIRLVMPCVSSDSEEPQVNISDIKLTENGDKRVLIEADVVALLHQFESRYPEWIEWFEGRCSSTAVSYYVTPAKDVVLIVVTSQDADTYWNTAWSGGQKRTMVSSAAAPQFNGKITGRCPHGAIIVPMGVLEEMDSWWDVTPFESARIKMTTGAGDTSALYELILQQLWRY